MSNFWMQFQRLQVFHVVQFTRIHVDVSGFSFTYNSRPRPPPQHTKHSVGFTGLALWVYATLAVLGGWWGLLRGCALAWPARLALSGIGSYKSVGGHIALSVLQHWSVTGDFNNHDLFDVSGFFNCLLFDGCRWSSFVETNRFSGFVVFAVACRVLTTFSNTCNSDVCHVASLATVVSPCSIQHSFAGEL